MRIYRHAGSSCNVTTNSGYVYHIFLHFYHSPAITMIVMYAVMYLLQASIPIIFSWCEASFQLWAVPTEHLPSPASIDYDLLHFSLGPPGGGATGCCVCGAGHHVCTSGAAAQVCWQHYAGTIPFSPGLVNGGHHHHSHFWTIRTLF